MKELKLNEIKNIELEILKSVHEFCIAYNIKYSLTFGTLLGAVRHKGFIPWDDDIDIMMPRNDYERFIASFNNKNYKVINYTSNTHFPFPWTKVYDARTIKKEGYYSKKKYLYGIDIDIFPVDSFDSTIHFSKSFTKMLKLKKYIIASLCHYSFVECLLNPKKLYKNLFISGRPHKYVSNLNKWITKFNNDNNHIYSIICDIYITYPFSFSKEIFDNLIDIKFEGQNFKSIKQYDWFLTECYCNYLEIPEGHKQISHHNNQCFSK